jgi:hypothetical protein
MYARLVAPNPSSVTQNARQILTRKVIYQIMIALNATNAMLVPSQHLKHPNGMTFCPRIVKMLVICLRALERDVTRMEMVKRNLLASGTMPMNLVIAHLLCPKHLVQGNPFGNVSIPNVTVMMTGRWIRNVCGTPQMVNANVDHDDRNPAKKWRTLKIAHESSVIRMEMAIMIHIANGVTRLIDADALDSRS